MWSGYETQGRELLGEGCRFIAGAKPRAGRLGRASGRPYGFEKLAANATCTDLVEYLTYV